MSAIERARSTLPDSLSVRLVAYVLVAAGALAAPIVMSPFQTFVLTTVLALGLYGAAYDLLYGYAGILSFGHAVFFGTGAFAVGVIVSKTDQGVLLGLLLAILIPAVLAVVVGAIALRISENGFIIVTIMVVEIAALLALTRTDLTGGTDGFTVLVADVDVFGLVTVSLASQGALYYFLLSLLVVSLYLLYRLVNSPFGLVFQLIRENEERARMLGYNVHAYKLAVFTVSGLFSGLAGAMSTLVTQHVSASQYSIMVSANPLVYTLLGGRTTLVGPVFGALFLREFSEIVGDFTDAVSLTIGVLLVAIVVLEPRGFIGLSRRIRARYFGGADDE